MTGARALGRVLLILLATRPGAVAAQGQGGADPCKPGPDSREAQAFAIKMVPLAFSADEAPGLVPSGKVRIALEAGYVPSVSDSLATPTICRPGKGPDNVNLVDFYVRPRVGVGLPWRLYLEFGWIPPITINGMTPNVFSGELLRSFAGTGPVTATARVFFTTGVVQGPITCPADALEDPDSECFGGTESDDAFHPNMIGVDGAVSYRLLKGRLLPYAGAGYTYLAPRFQVNFTNRFGETDRRKVEVDMSRLALFGGLTWRAGAHLALSGEAYSMPADAVTGRVMGRWEF